MFIVGFSIVASSYAFSQEEKKKISYEKIKEFIEKGDDDFSESAKSNEYFPDIICTDLKEHKETVEKCWKAYQASLDYYSVGLEHRKDVFKWQHTTTKVIFFVVIFLVLSGIYFAWMQFRRDENSSDASDDKEHSVEISTSGIKVSSPVLGVIILTLSLAFFYLYLLYVYPITELF